MPTPLQTITRQATRNNQEPLNVLVMCNHERYETGLAKTNHNFYALRTADGRTKDWELAYASVPKNYTLLDPQMGGNLPSWIDFDVVLSHNKFNQFQILAPIAYELQIPLISLEHVLPYSDWPTSRLLQFRQMKGDVNIFISEYSRKEWGWSENEALVIHHGVDTDFFKPVEGINKKRHILSAVNDWMNRDAPCGFNLWRRVTQGLPVHPIGKTPGLSQPATGQDLVNEYNEAQVFINTSLISPIPTSLLEAMSVGVACVSTATCMIPEIIQDGYNGYITNDEKCMRDRLVYLLDHPEKCKELGENARKTILEKFGMDRFVDDWNKILYLAADFNRLKG